MSSSSSSLSSVPPPSSVWSLIKKYAPVHSPLGALHLILGCLKKISSPKGSWMETSSNVFGDSNFFMERADLIIQAEKWSKMASPERDNENFAFISSITVEKTNSYLIQDLLVLYMEESAVKKPLEFLGSPSSPSASSMDSLVDIEVHENLKIPEIEKCWPFYHQATKTWGIIKRNRTTSPWNPVSIFNLVSRVKLVAFRARLGAEQTQTIANTWGWGENIIPISPVLSASDKPFDVYLGGGRVLDAKQSFRRDLLKTEYDELFKKMVKNVPFGDRQYEADVISMTTKTLGGLIEENPNDAWSIYKRRWTQFGPDIGYMIVDLALLGSGEGVMDVEFWTDYYDELLKKPQKLLFGSLSRSKTGLPSDIPTISSLSAKKKKQVRFLSPTKGGVSIRDRSFESPNYW